MSHSYLPIVGEHDDKSRFLPHDASRWQKIRHHGTTRRLCHVIISIFIAAACLAIVNTTMMHRNIKCVSLEDCRRARQLNTTVVGIRSLLNTLIAVVLIFAILSQLGVDPMALLATAGVLGVIVGFGAQSLIKSLIAGMQIMVSGKFSVGDYINLELTSNAPVKGIVVDFSLQTTTIRDLAGAKYFVSNGDVLAVTNYSQNHQRAQVEVSISHMSDVNAVLSHLQDLTVKMASEEALLDKVIRPPVVKGVTATGAESFTIAIAAIAIPSQVLFVERFMRQRILAFLHTLNVMAATQHTFTVHAPEKSDSFAIPEQPPRERFLSPETIRSGLSDETDEVVVMTSNLDLSA